MANKLYTTERYRINNDPSQAGDRFGFTDEIQEKFEECFEQAPRGDYKTIRKLKKYIKQHPEIPHFKNMLGVAYDANGQQDKVREWVERVNREHPDYLFGRMNMAEMLLAEGNTERVPELLGEKMDLPSLYPDRKNFHIREVMEFLLLCVRYYIETKNFDRVEQCLDLMADLGTAEPEYGQALDLWTYTLMGKGVEYMDEVDVSHRTVASAGYNRNIQTDQPPAFDHDLVEELYKHGLDIDHDLVRRILALPRESLIGDLEKVVEDGIRRYEYFRSRPGDEGSSLFLYHALFMLGELDAEESLPVVLRLLRQGEELLEFWFYTDLGEVMPDVLFKLGGRRLDALKAFMQEPNRYGGARDAVQKAALRVGLHQPDRREQVIKWYRDLFNFFLGRQKDDRIIETDLISFMIWSCLDLNAVELKGLIKKLYDGKLVNTVIVGTFEEVIGLMETVHLPDTPYPMPDIYTRYDQMTDDWDLAALENEPDFFGEPDPFRPAIKDEQETVELGEKVGRNDPCPCGSGRKYKHCCLD